MSTLEQLLGPAQVSDTLCDAMNVLEGAIRTQPRSMQKLIGPSEIGTDCDHCLAAKLAGWDETERDVAWVPFMGTAIHAELARIFETDAAQRGEQSRWMVEHRVKVGTIGGHQISGTCDLFDQHTGTVLDWKNTGTTSLRAAKRSGPKQVYRIQAHLYGLGYENAGHEVREVAIAHLPRTSMRLSDAVLWSEPYHRQIALDALERANKIHANLQALASINTKTRDAWITSQPRADGCFSCPRYPDWTPTSRLSSEFGTTTSSTDRKAA